MRRCRELEAPGGACCLETTGGANEKGCAAKVFNVGGAALISRPDCPCAPDATTAVKGEPE